MAEAHVVMSACVSHHQKYLSFWSMNTEHRSWQSNTLFPLFSTTWKKVKIYWYIIVLKGIIVKSLTTTNFYAQRDMIACKGDLLRSEVFPINHQHVTWEGVVVRRNSKPACFPCKAIETGVLLTRLHFLSDLTQFDTPVFSKKSTKFISSVWWKALRRTT